MRSFTELWPTLKRLLAYGSPWRKPLAIAVAMMWIAAAAEVSGPLLISYFIDNMVAKHTLPLKLVAGLAVAYIGLQLLAALLHYNQSLLFNRAAVGVVQQLRSDVMDAALHQPLSEFDTQPVGQLISRVTNDTEVIRDLYVTVVATVLRSAALIGAMLVAIAIFPAVLIVMIIYQRYSTPIVRRVRAWLADINDGFNEVINGMGVIQQFRQQARFGERMREASYAHYLARMQTLRLDGFLLRPLLSLFSSLVLCGLLMLFGFSAVGTIEVGVLYAFISYLGRLNEPLIELTTQQSMLQQAVVAGERVFELMDRLHEAVVDRFGNRIFDQLGTRHPTLDGRPAEISADDADRHAQTLFQFLRECVGDRRPARHAFRVRLLPPSSGRKHRLLRRPLEWDEQADIRIANHRHIALPHFHLHVGLSRSEPHLAHSHVAERRGILSRNDPHHQPGVGRERPEQYLPVACAVGPRLVTFSRESQPDRRAGGGPAPDRNAASALQHHPVAENHRQPQVPRQVLGHGTIQAVIRERHRIARRIEPGNAQAESRHMVFDSDFEQHRSVGVVGNDDLPRPPVLPVDDRSPDDGKIILPLRLQNGKMSLLPHAEITVLPAKRLESRITRRGSDPQ